MGQGGKRAGAGRKKSSATVKTREIADKHAESGSMMPLDVMLKAMMIKADAQDWDGAAEHAKNAAPYTHPKLQAIEVGGPNGKDEIEIRLVEPMDRAKALAALLAGVKA